MPVSTHLPVVPILPELETPLGVLSALDSETGSDLTALGYDASPIACCNLTGSTPINNAFTICHHSIITTSHSGVFGNISLQKIGGYVNWGTASDGRMKTAVQEDVKGLDFILQLYHDSPDFGDGQDG